MAGEEERVGEESDARMRPMEGRWTVAVEERSVVDGVRDVERKCGEGVWVECRCGSVGEGGGDVDRYGSLEWRGTVTSRPLHCHGTVALRCHRCRWPTRRACPVLFCPLSIVSSPPLQRCSSLCPVSIGIYGTNRQGARAVWRWSTATVLVSLSPTPLQVVTVGSQTQSVITTTAPLLSSPVQCPPVIANHNCATVPL